MARPPERRRPPTIVTSHRHRSTEMVQREPRLNSPLPCEIILWAKYYCMCPDFPSSGKERGGIDPQRKCNRCGGTRDMKKKLSGLEIFWKAGKKFSWSGKRSVKKALSVFQKREGFKLRGKKRALLMKCADFVRLARKWLSVRWSMRFDWLTDCLSVCR